MNKVEKIKKSVIIDCLLVIVTFGVLAVLVLGYAKNTTMEVELLTPEFVLGDDVQYEVEISGKYELKLETVDKQEREVTDIYIYTLSI